jgi:SPP1 family predicted phage head-tail adaptor
MPEVNISELRHRITFQDMTRASDSQGGHTTTWVDVTTVWAKISPASGMESVFAQTITPKYDHNIIIRNTTGLHPRMRIKYGDRFFQIHSIARVDERRWWIKILAKEGVAS